MASTWLYRPPTIAAVLAAAALVGTLAVIVVTVAILAV